MPSNRSVLYIMALYGITWTTTKAFSSPQRPDRMANTQRLVSASASSSEFTSNNSNRNEDVANQASEYFESISSALREEDIEQKRVEERLKSIQRRNGDTFKVTVPLKNIGMTIVQVLPGRQIVPKELNLDSLATLQALDKTASTKITRMLLDKMDDSFRGLVVASVDPNSSAAGQGVRPGTILKAASATLGEAVWPKATLEGLQAALTSRQATASEVVFDCSNNAIVLDNKYELTLTKPIGMLLQEKDGQVIVTGLTEQASNLVRYAVQVGDRVMEIDSSMGGKFWPVSTVDGVISACTSRLPGQSVRMILERPQEAIASDGLSGPSLANGRTASTLATTDTQSNNGAVAAPAGTDPTLLLSRCRDALRKYGKESGSKVEKYALPAVVADKVMDALASASVTVDPVTLSMIMKAFLSCQQFERAIKAFESATGFKGDGSVNRPSDVFQGGNGNKLVSSETSLNLYTASALLQAHAMNNDLPSVSRVLAALEGRSGVEINGIESALWSLTGSYGSTKLDTTCYNIALSAAEKVGGQLALQNALDIFHRMELSNDVKKDVVTYNTVISALINAGESEEAFRLFSEMTRSGIRPDKYTYTSLMKGCTHDGDMEEILYDMRERGVQADVVTYNTMLKCLCDDRKFTQATRLVGEMETRGVEPNSMTYGLLMSSMLKAKKANACLTLFESACSSSRTAALTQNVHLYTTAVTAASALGDYERALELISRMKANGVSPSLQTLTAVMGACMTSNKPELASQLFGRIENPDGYAITQGVRALCAAGDSSSALEVLQKKGKGALLSGKEIMQCYGAILHESLQSSSFQTARDTVIDLLGKGYIVNKAMFDSLAGVSKAFDKENDLEKFSFCLFLIDSVRARNLPVEGRLYASTLFLGNRLGGLPRQLVSLIARSKIAAGTSARQILSSKPDDVDTEIHLEHLLTTPESFQDEIALPPIPVRVATRDMRAVFKAEQLVWSKVKRRRVLL